MHQYNLSRVFLSLYINTGERGGSVVECRTPEREVGGSIPTAAVLCPWARHFTPRKYWLITQEAVAPSRHDWKIVDWDVKPQHKQTNCTSIQSLQRLGEPVHQYNLSRVLVSLYINTISSETWWASTSIQSLQSWWACISIQSLQSLGEPVHQYDLSSLGEPVHQYDLSRVLVSLYSNKISPEPWWACTSIQSLQCLGSHTQKLGLGEAKVRIVSLTLLNYCISTSDG